ncbi:MAG: PTS transporter subunit EIIC [Candidatus Velthaea sp.]
MAWLERRLEPVAIRFAEAPAIVALREALPISFAGLILGLVGILTFAERGGPVARAQHAFSPARIAATLDLAFTAMAVALVCALAVMLARRLRLPFALAVPATLAAFALSLPRPPAPTGASGLFLAIVVALLTAGAVVGARARWGAARSWLGAAAVVGVAFTAFSLHLSLAHALAALIEPLGALGDTYSALVVIALLHASLWLVGIHGPALLAAVLTPIYLKLQFANTAAYAHGDPVPHIVVVSTFLFVYPGGAGATLPLSLMLLRAKSARLRKIAYAALGPSIFNANEPLLIGLPLIFNPYLALPFVAAPAALATTTYLAMRFGLVRPPAFYVPSSVPPFLNVALATFDWRAVVLLLANVLLSALIYTPFVRILDRMETAKERAAAG